MELKLNDEGHAVVEDGKPVYVHSDGKESAFDAPGTLATIKNLNSEAKGHRVGKEAAESALKAFEGIADPAAALAAMDTIKNMGDKKLIDAGEVDKVREAAVKAVEEKYAPITEDNARLTGELYKERVGGKFARSEYIKNKCAVPSDVMEAMFGGRFKDEGGQAVGYDANGNQIYSRENPGVLATFEEALEVIVDGYGGKDSLLKGTGGGSGAKSANGGATGEKTITRADLAKLTPQAQMDKISKDGYTVTD